MTIAQSTTIQAYQLRSGGTPARMAILRMIAANSNAGNKPPSMDIADWRAARNYTMRAYQDAFCHLLFQGLTDGGSVWYSHGGMQFRNERDAHEIVSLNHTGWFTDAECQDGLVIGIVARLSHGRFISGYRLTMNDERVYFPEIFDCERDAARMADEHARIIGESESEYQSHQRAGRDLQDKIEESLKRLRECVALRHREGMDYVRDEITNLIDSIRDDRLTMQREFSDVEA